MATSTAILLDLGVIVTKAALRAWLKDENIGLETSMSILDVFRKIPVSELAQHSAETNFRRVSIQFSKELAQVFEREGTRFDESTLTAIAEAVRDVLLAKPFDVATMVSANLNPAKLISVYREPSSSLFKWFSDAEKALAEQTLQYCVHFMTATASRLPSFTERTLGEVLQREDQIYAVVAELMAEFRRIQKASSAEQEKNDQSFEAAYRLGIANNLDELQLFGLKVSDASRRHQLSVAYVSLTARGDQASDVSSGTPQDSVEAAIAAAQAHIIISGPAGSGKTTLLQWLAVRLARDELGGSIQYLNGRIPFFLRLRECAYSGLPTLDALVAQVLPELSTLVPDDWVHRILETGRGVVLLDGIDEVPKALRTQLHKWIGGLLNLYPKCVIITSSRPYAVVDRWLNKKGFKTLELQAMNIASISKFVEHWHHAVAAEASEAPSIAMERATALKDIIKSSKALRELCETPLLCAMVCALNRDRHHHLPSDRIELYADCCDALVERRDPERRIALGEYPAITLRQKHAILQDLAYWMMRNGLTQVELGAAKARLSDKLASLGLAGDQLDGICALLTDRSGIVREPVPDALDFVHRTFLEFLAAREAVQQHDFGLLLEHAADDQWQETIIMAAGVGGSRAANRLVAGLLDSARRSSGAKSHQCILMAVACLETAVELKKELRVQVVNALRQIVPPRTLTEAKMMSAAGDLVVPYLATRAGISATRAAASIRALGLIGTDAAMKALETYAFDNRQKVAGELVRAWDNFDRSDYAARALKGLDEISLRRPDSISGIKHLRSLKRAAFLDIGVGLDFSELGELSGLEVLAITGEAPGNSSFDPTSLRGLASLRDLSLSSLQMLSSFPVETVSRLSKLDLRRVVVGPSRSVLRADNLTQLFLSQVRGISDFGWIKRCSKLEHLFLDSVEGLRFLPVPEHTDHLSSLRLRNVEFSEPLAEIALHRNLETLMLAGNLPDIKDTGALCNLKALARLSLTRLGSLKDVDGLASMESLAELTLQNLPKLRAIDGLERHAEFARIRVFDAPALEGISIPDGCRIGYLALGMLPRMRDLGFLAGLHIESLFLEGLSVRTLEPLLEIPSLKRLAFVDVDSQLPVPPQLRKRNMTRWGVFDRRSMWEY